MAREFILDDRPRAAADPRFREALNDEQLAVVTAGDGPTLVIAGAGTGKTRALTYRVAHLIESGVPPGAILLLTFTNRAAAEMLLRVDELVGARGRGVVGGTFHSVARRLLRQYSDRLGYPESFGILDREDAESVMKQCIAIENTTPTETRFPRAGSLVMVLSQACNTGRSAMTIFADEFTRFMEHAETVERVLIRYQSRKFELGVMDFDDLLVNWRRLLLEHDDVRAAMQDRFRHVLVDEYQDTNRMQAEIVDTIGAGHRNVMVVGDDCQSIYSFRGADFRNILEFPDRYSESVTHRLVTNYRSSPQILALANATIARNPRQFTKSLRSVSDDGPLSGHVRCSSEDEQAMFVAQRVLQLRDEGVPLDRVAVLYRAHSHSMQLQIELSRRNIPFRVQSGQRFFEQRHVKDVLAFLRFIENPRDELAFQRVAGLAEGIGPRTSARLYAHVRSFDDLASGLRDESTLRLCGRRGAVGWSQLAEVLVALSSDPLRRDPARALDRVIDGFYERHALTAFDNGANRVRELQSLAELASRYGDAEEFLQTLALASDITGADSAAPGEPDERLVLSSIHQAKGLEFHTVFVIWLADERFPSAQAVGQEAFDEERRLFYVAVTRAQRELYLTTPLMTFERGVGLVALRESPFVEELALESPSVMERITLIRKGV